MPTRARALADDPRTTTVLLALAVLLTGSGILSTAIVDDDTTVSAALDRASVEPGESRSTDGSGAPLSGSGGLPGEQEETDAGPPPANAASPPTTTTTTSSTGESAQPDPTLTITSPGAYRERITTTSSDGSTDSEEVSLVVERVGGSGDDVRMSQRRESDGRDMGVTYEMAWRPDGVYLLSTTWGQGGFDVHCEHDPPLLHSPRLLEPGVEWEGEDTCEFDTAGGGTVHFRYEARVRGATTITVAGTRLSVWLIDTVTDADVTTAFGDFSQHSEGPVWVDPSRGLTVRSEDDVTVSGGQGEGGGQPSRVVRELLTLEPA